MNHRLTKVWVRCDNDAGCSPLEKYAVGEGGCQEIMVLGLVVRVLLSTGGPRKSLYFPLSNMLLGEGDG